MGHECSESEFQCAGGFCIASYKRCNGIVDCLSGNDEENCDDIDGNQIFFLLLQRHLIENYIFLYSKILQNIFVM